MNLASANRKVSKPFQKEKITYEHRETYYNAETGEIKEETKKQTIQIPKEDEYIKIYIKAVGLLHNLPNSADKIVFELIKYVNYDNEIIINKTMKKNIANRLAISLSRVNMYISDLSKKNILIRKARGVYILNPHLFGKGNWHDIYRLRKELELNVIFKEGEVEIINAGEKE
jgi:hypothetical protein